MEVNKLTEVIIGCAIEVHKHLGPGLLESSYETCLHYEIVSKEIAVKRQLGLPLIYKEIFLEHGYRLDLLVADTVVVEVKSASSICELHVAQLLTYLKLSNAKVGLILNFNVLRMTDGIRRLVARSF